MVCIYTCTLLQEPVILTNTKLVASALHWDMDYLTENMGEGMFTVYTSDTGHFKYYNDKKSSSFKDFVPPTSSREMSFKEFREMLMNRQECDKKWVYVYILCIWYAEIQIS